MIFFFMAIWFKVQVVRFMVYGFGFCNKALIKVFKKNVLLQEPLVINIKPDLSSLFLQHQFLHVSIVFVARSDHFITRL